MFADGVFFPFCFGIIFIVNGMLDFSNFLKAVADVSYMVSQNPGKKDFFKSIEDNNFVTDFGVGRGGI